MGLQQEKKHYRLVVRVGGPASLDPSIFPSFHTDRVGGGGQREPQHLGSVLGTPLTSQPALALQMEILVSSLQLCLCFVSPYPPRGPRVHLLLFYNSALLTFKALCLVSAQQM